MYRAAFELPIDSAVSESVMVMSMSEQTTADKYTLEGGKVMRRKERGRLVCNTVMSGRTGSIQEGEGEKGQVEPTRTPCRNKRRHNTKR